MEKLADKLNRIMEECDPWGYRDAEYSVGQARYDIQNNPEKVIDGLLDYLDVELESKRAPSYSVRTNSYRMASYLCEDVNDFVESIHEKPIPMKIETGEFGIMVSAIYPQDVERFKTAVEYAITILTD